METKSKKTTSEKIAELKKQITNCKDARQSEKLLNQLLALHKSTFEMNRLLDIPLSEIKEEIDFGATKLYHTIRGYAFECKGGMITFVEHRMSRVCAMFNTIFELNKKEDKTEEEQEIYNQFTYAVGCVMQAPLFGSMSEQALFGIATDIIRHFNDYCESGYVEATAQEETEEDIKENIETENIAKGIEILADSPLPPEDNR